jgi:hypothetical protein
MDLFYSFLKVTSMVATGAFGALGLLTKYKDDRGKITKWGKTALGGIVISSGITLGLYVLETSRAKAAADRAKAQTEATATKLQAILVNAQTTADQQKTSLEETNELKVGLAKTLDQQMINLGTTKAVAKDMRMSITAQKAVLAGNERISNNLSNAVTTLNQTSKTTSSVLEETVNRIDSLEVLFIVRMDPLAFNDVAGKRILSDKSIKLLTDDKAGKSELDDDDRKAIINEFEQHYIIARDIIFSDWAAGTSIVRPHVSKGHWDFDFSGWILPEQGHSGMRGLFFGYSEQGMGFGVKYNIPPNRYDGIRQYKDLNGAVWRVELKTGNTAFELVSASLSPGDFMSGVEMKAEEIVLEKGKYSGEKVIPADQFRTSNQ